MSKTIIPNPVLLFQSNGVVSVGDQTHSPLIVGKDNVTEKLFEIFRGLKKRGEVLRTAVYITHDHIDMLEEAIMGGEEIIPLTDFRMELYTHSSSIRRTSSYRIWNPEDGYETGYTNVAEAKVTPKHQYAGPWQSISSIFEEYDGKQANVVGVGSSRKKLP